VIASYYRDCFALLAREEPSIPTTNSDLPSAVASWYALPDGLLLLREYSNCDDPLEPDDFEFCTQDSKNLATFLHENQGVCRWAFDLNGGDDPAVFINYDPTTDPWSLCCDRFSTFIFTRLFDFRHWCHPRLSASGGGPPLSAEVLGELRQRYCERASSRGWPGDVQYRFSDEDRRILICESDDWTGWYFSADTPESLMKMVERFRQQLTWNTDVPDQ
jgi:hypothetical protein